MKLALLTGLSCMERRVLSISTSPRMGWYSSPIAVLEEKHYFAQGLSRDILAGSRPKIHGRLLHLPCNKHGTTTKQKLLIDSSFTSLSPAMADVNVSLIWFDLIIEKSNQTFHGTF